MEKLILTVMLTATMFFVTGCWEKAPNEPDQVVMWVLNKAVAGKVSDELIEQTSTESNRMLTGYDLLKNGHVELVKEYYSKGSKYPGTSKNKEGDSATVRVSVVFEDKTGCVMRYRLKKIEGAWKIDGYDIIEEK